MKEKKAGPQADIIYKKIETTDFLGSCRKAGETFKHIVSYPQPYGLTEKLLVPLALEINNLISMIKTITCWW